MSRTPKELYDEAEHAYFSQQERTVQPEVNEQYQELLDENGLTQKQVLLALDDLQNSCAMPQNLYKVVMASIEIASGA